MSDVRPDDLNDLDGEGDELEEGYPTGRPSDDLGDLGEDLGDLGGDLGYTTDHSHDEGAEAVAGEDFWYVT